MKTISTEEFKLESGDAVETLFHGRTFKKVTKEGEEPCVFAYTKACDFLCASGICACKGYMWAEKTEALRRKHPLARCRHCGKFDSGMEEVDVGEGVKELWCSDCRKTDAKTCPKCGKHKASFLFADVDGITDGQWCDTCRAEHTVKCPRCGRHVVTELATTSVVSVDSTTGAAVVQTWCQTCASRSAAVCSDCGKHVDSRHAANLNGRVICPSCAEARHMHRCSICGRLTTNPPNSRGRSICDGCRSEGHGSPVHSYHGFDNTLVFWDRDGAHTQTPDPGTLYLGFELESGGASESGSIRAADAVHALDPDEERFHLERDGTIPSYGFELISAPHTLEGHFGYDWDKVLKVLVKNGLRSHDLSGKCGLHVHVSKSYLSGPDMAKMDLFILKNKTFWEKIARRPSNGHAQYVDKPVRQHGRSSDTAGRYAAVNFCNARTVEFRIFRGTLNHASLMGTLAIVDGICNWVKTRNSVQILKNEGETDNFYAWLKANGAKYAPAVAYIDKRNALSLDGEL